MPPIPVSEASSCQAGTAGSSNTVENSDGANTGHVILGILGGIALAIILVVVIVPLMRWRQRGGSTAGKSRSLNEKQSRSSSRRTHARIFSAPDAVIPLLDERTGALAEQSAGGMISKEGAGLVSQVQTTSKNDGLSRPPSAMFNWKILETLPNFSDDSLSSLGRPLEPGEQLEGPFRAIQSPGALEALNPDSQKHLIGEPILRVTPASQENVSPLSHLTAPERQDTGASGVSQSGTLVNSSSSVPPPSPLTGAFQNVFSPVSPSPTASADDAFAYPSFIVSQPSTNPNPSSDVQQPASDDAPALGAGSLSNPANARPPSWVSNPLALVSGPAVDQASTKIQTPPATHRESLWRQAPMPSIPESLRSPVSASQTSESPYAPSPASIAHLRDSSASTVPRTPRHVRGLSAETTLSPPLSRATTQRAHGQISRASMSGSIIEPPESAMTHHTFGVPWHSITSPDFFVPPVPFSSGRRSHSSIPFPSSPPPPAAEGEILYETDGSALRSRFSVNSSQLEESDEEARRRTVSYPREPSPPLTTAPLSHPPFPPALRHATPYRFLPNPSQSSSQPQPQTESLAESQVQPQLPPRPAAEPESDNEEQRASPASSTENLLPQLPAVLPGLRPISPFRFDFGFGGSDSRSATPVERRSALASKASSLSRSRSKRAKRQPSLRSQEQEQTQPRSGNNSRSTSRSRSRSKSRGSRRVTFGNDPPPLPSPVPSMSSGNGRGAGSGSGHGGSLRQSSFRALPPIPTRSSASPSPAQTPPPSAMRPTLRSSHNSASTAQTSDTAQAQDGHGDVH